MPRHGPFRILVSAVLSTRTQDATTTAAARRLFRGFRNPSALARATPAELEPLVRPVGFYRTKARLLPELGRRLTALGRVPDTVGELTLLPGVGRKVANIVLADAWGQDVIAVDTHVHRISNRLGLVRTRTPEQTEPALMKVLPRAAWREWNYLLVAFGQTICRPVRPRCGGCPLFEMCLRRGVRQTGQSERKTTR
jgi:endonuclease-3